MKGRGGHLKTRKDSEFRLLAAFSTAHERRPVRSQRAKPFQALEGCPACSSPCPEACSKLGSLQQGVSIIESAFGKNWLRRRELKGILNGEVASWGQSNTFNFLESPFSFCSPSPWSHDQGGTLDHLWTWVLGKDPWPQTVLETTHTCVSEAVLLLEGMGPQWAASMVEQGDQS